MPMELTPLKRKLALERTRVGSLDVYRGMIGEQAVVAIVTGHGDATFGSAGTTLDMQSWGTVLPLSSLVEPASDALSNAIVVDFDAGLNATGTDTVSLQNYTILRYPAQ